VTEGGALYTWGRGANGQLGHGDTTDQAVPKRVEPVLKDKMVVKVACGENHSAAIDDAGRVYVSGGTQLFCVDTNEFGFVKSFFSQFILN
jgi:alpha-tubulin suppressor-like RCC1 family protein